MRPLLAGWGCVRMSSPQRLVPVGGGGRGRLPLVAPLVHLPRFGLAILQTEVATRVGRSTEADLIPSVRMGVVSVDGVAYQQDPEAVRWHALPDLLGALGLVR